MKDEGKKGGKKGGKKVDTRSQGRESRSGERMISVRIQRRKDVTRKGDRQRS